jgi:hypothetical protein
MRLVYSIHSYSEAKEFLKDAIIIKEFHNSNVHSNVTYKKPDGSIWHESESHLEYPMNGYCLKKIK